MDNTAKETQKPKILYQYRPPKEWAFGNLNRRVMYFSPPQKFNDPYDIGVPLSFRCLSEAQYRRGCDIRDIPYDAAIPRDEFVCRANRFFRKEQLALRKSSGITCLSKDSDNLLMWSHYAGSGEGFCVGFDTSALEHDMDVTKRPLRQVDYKKDLPQNAPVDIWVNDAKKSLAELFSYKSCAWGYENEWRIFSPEVGEADYRAETLKCVFIGSEASSNTTELIRTIVADKYPSAKLFRMERKTNKFKLDPIPI